MRAHVTQTVLWCFVSLRQIRRSVSTTTLQMLAVVSVHPRLDYGNIVLVGLQPIYNVQRRLQSVLNLAARLIYHLFGDRISDALEPALVVSSRAYPVQCGGQSDVKSSAGHRTVICGISGPCR